MQVTRLSALYGQLVPATITPLAGTDRLLLIFVGGADNTNKYTAMSLNGVPLVEIADIVESANVEAWQLAIPDAWSGALAFSATGSGRIEIMQFANVDPTDPILDFQSDSSGSSTDTLASVNINCDAEGWVEDQVNTTGNIPTKGANQTADYGSVGSGMSYYTTPVTGSVNMRWTFLGSRNVLLAVSLRPSSDFIPIINFL